MGFEQLRRYDVQAKYAVALSLIGVAPFLFASWLAYSRYDGLMGKITYGSKGMFVPAFAGAGLFSLALCTVAFLLAPGLFEGKRCNLSVETTSELTMGHTSVDFWQVTDRPKNVDWIYDVDADGFYELLTERLARFG